MAQAIDRSRGGLSSKIHLAVDALGNPLRILLTAGQAGDVTSALALIEGMRPRHVIAVAAYDAGYFRDAIAVAGGQAECRLGLCSLYSGIKAAGTLTTFQHGRG